MAVAGIGTQMAGCSVPQQPETNVALEKHFGLAAERLRNTGDLQAAATFAKSQQQCADVVQFQNQSMNAGK